MQDPPQQQSPSNAPSEIYLPEQPEAHYQSIHTDITQYPAALAEHEIVIYPNRTQAIARTTVCGCALVLGIVTLAVMLAFFFILGSTYQVDYIVPSILYLALMIPVLIFAAWATWSMAQLVIQHVPLLIINRQGITTGKTFMLSSFFIAWHEIEAIYAHTFIYTYLCIRPKDTKRFLKRFHSLERFNRQSNALIGVPPLAIPQTWLGRSAEEILEQLQFFYAHELREQQIN